MIVEWGGERLELLPQRAVLWRAAGALLLADPHFGKDEVFRRAGVPVPDAVAAADVARLAALVDAVAPRRVIVLGDFLHSRDGAGAEALAALGEWRKTRPALELVNVRGNHDRGAGDPPPALGVECVDEPWACGPFEMRHHPAVPRRAGGFALAGHLHPAVRLHDEDGTTMRAPAFLLRDRCAILPAFGRFTGTAVVPLRRGDAAYAVGPDVVVEVTRGAGKGGKGSHGGAESTEAARRQKVE